MINTETWTFIILAFILFPFALNALIEWLDSKSAGSKSPDEVKDVYALKKLSQSNLTPHPLKIFFKYSHPTIVERIRAIRSITK